MFPAEKVAKMSKDNFFEWLKSHMLINDPNGEYTIEWLKSHIKETFSILLQWIKDSNGADNCSFWLSVAIIKLKNYLEKGSD